jgi:hypothetical protein
MVSSSLTVGSNTQNPDVAAYVAAMKGSPWTQDETAETSYSNLMFLYTAAKKIGFANFNSASLTKFMDQTSSNGTPVALSRSLVVPGATGYPQVRQPYVLIVQSTGISLNTVTKGTDQGWVNGFAP